MITAEKIRGKMKFSLEAGALIRSSIRNALNKMKIELEYADPKCTVTITEQKSLLESEFVFVAMNITETELNWILNCQKKIKSHFGG